MLAVYAIVNGNQAGWLSAQTLGLLAASAVLLVAFLVRRVAGRARRSSRSDCSGGATSRPRTSVGVLWAAAMFAWFFLSALYLQLVLGYSPLQVGLAFLPGEPDHGRAVARPVGEAGDAVRDQAPAGRSA